MSMLTDSMVFFEPFPYSYVTTLISPVTQVVKFLTESPAGGLPLGFLVLSNHTEMTLDAGIEALKALMPEGAFYNRGKEVGPKVILTDDDTGEINSLKRAWPFSVMLNCQWHNQQVKQIIFKSYANKTYLKNS